MSARYDAFYVIHFIDEVPEAGVSEGEANALHVTFLPEVYTNNPDASSLLWDALVRVVARSSQFTLEAGDGTEFFGATGEYEVQTFVNSDDAQAFHYDLFTQAEQAGLSVAERRFCGANFRPHMTLTGTHMPLGAPKSVTVDSLTLVRHHGGWGGPVEVVGTVLLDQ